MDLQEQMEKEFEKFLKENKISSDNIRNNHLVLDFLKGKMKEAAYLLYSLAGDYRDCTDNHYLKTPGNEVRNYVSKVKGIIGVAHDQLYHVKRLGGEEQAKELIKLEVERLKLEL